jgi:hypothetical protein
MLCESAQALPGALLAGDDDHITLFVLFGKIARLIAGSLQANSTMDKSSLTFGRRQSFLPAKTSFFAAESAYSQSSAVAMPVHETPLWPC